MQQLQYIIIGDLQSPSFTFEGGDILSISGDLSVDMIGAELCTDVMEAEVSYDDADGMLRALPWATPVYFYRGEHLEGKLYSVSVTRIGRKAYRIRTTSAAGIMDHETFYGGMYSGETFKTVVEQVIKTNALQPFDGVYRHLIWEYSLDSVAYSVGMGQYKDQAKTQEDVWGCYLSATMSSKLSAKIKIKGFSNQSYNNLFDYPGTAYRSNLLGAFSSESEPENVKNHRYGLCMDVSRANTSVPFPVFGPVYFAYGYNVIYLGTPSSADEAVYEIDVDPGAGTAVINGVTYAIDLISSIANDACALHVYGGGADLYDTNGSTTARYTCPHCDYEIFYYIVRSPSGELQADQTAVRNIFSGEIDLYDCSLRKLYRRLYAASVLIDDLEPYDFLTYGPSILFVSKTDFIKDVLDRLSYAEGIDTLPIHGWLPICTKREALQQLLFVTGVILIKDEDGSILFTAPSTQSTANIGDPAVYDEGSEDQPEHINTVELTEHSYTVNVTSDFEPIYENNTGSADGYYIAEFSSAPAKSAMDEYISSDYMIYLSANCNAAIVTGTGKFVGRPYRHVEKVLRRGIANYPDGHGVSVPDATLVTLLESNSVLDRLEAYYRGSRKTHVDVVLNGERCGLMYSLRSAFGEAFSGFMVRANKTITSIVRAACKFVQGYIPPQIGGGYTNYVILTGSGTWTVPASVFEKETPRVHVVLIGGGKGGDGGYAGEHGVQPVRGESAEVAEGGAAGDPGSGGKIFDATITDPAAVYVYSCGQGGTGGAISNSHSVNNPGSPGGDTTFSGGSLALSSGSGASSEDGIINSITGERYAWHMLNSWGWDDYSMQFEKGGGGRGGYCTAESWGSSYHHGYTCQQVIMNRYQTEWSPGFPGADHNVDGWLLARGGGGGGGGYGQIGSNGSAASYSDGVYRSGNGGKGGDATETPPKATDYNPAYYGYGGLGGGGGGGGGAGGWATGNYPSVTGTGGAGGYGGRGGDGGDGCVLIYY